nr:PREDICTED: DNA-(apurinic or apyrimidinic site) lyase-like [Apteryx mantelli mantelli]
MDPRRPGAGTQASGKGAQASGQQGPRCPGLSPQWVQEEAPDVLCLQETKCGGSAVPPEVRALPGLPHQFWASAEGKPGYSGVGLLARHEPLSVTYGIGEAPGTPKYPIHTPKHSFIPQITLILPQNTLYYTKTFLCYPKKLFVT